MNRRALRFTKTIHKYVHQSPPFLFLRVHFLSPDSRKGSAAEEEYVKKILEDPFSRTHVRVSLPSRVHSNLFLTTRQGASFVTPDREAEKPMKKSGWGREMDMTGPEKTFKDDIID